MTSRSFVLAVHGGAGAAHDAPDFLDPAREGLRSALEAGGRILAAGGTSLDAVVAAVVILEDCPVFNAGRGSALTESGDVEMDAAVMEGGSRRAGAVAGVRRVAHPVAAAVAVLQDGRHVLMTGEGADRFALEQGVAGADPESFVTAHRRAQLERSLARIEASRRGGTVGAVARDGDGHLAAATSTGGLTAKRSGRVSDSALIGAGTWADDATCAISATGEGELFIRAGFAHAVDGWLRHAGCPLDEACRRALEDVAALGGSGGCVAVDANGAVALPFDTPAMSRGVLRADEAPWIALATEDARVSSPA